MIEGAFRDAGIQFVSPPKAAVAAPLPDVEGKDGSE
jgi:hypothetical protein